MPDFEEIYRLYFADVYKYILALSRDEATAEEITQETFFRALSSIDSFRGTASCGCGCARSPETGIWTSAGSGGGSGTAPRRRREAASEEGFADRDTARRLHALLHALPEPYKEVFSLRTFGELSFGEIGALFQKSESWARVTYFRARQKLKEGLSDEL